MAGWQPDQVKLDQVGQLLSGAADPTNHQVHVQALQMLDQAKRDYPDFGCYLLVVFCKMPSAALELRQLAGIHLKNTIKDKHMKTDVLGFVRSEVLSMLGDPERIFRRTAAQIVTTIVAREDSSLKTWPELLPKLMELLNSGSENHVEGSLGALRLICEDHTRQLCEQEFGERLNQMIAKFISLFHLPRGDLRAAAINCIRQFILPLPNAFLMNMDSFLKGLLDLHKDSSAEVRKEICTSLCLLAEMKADFLADPNICTFVIEFLLWTTEHDSDYDVKKEACEFWSTICENDEVPAGVLKPYLTRLTLVLLNGMVYSEEELSVLSDDLDSVPDKTEEINPASLHHHSKHAVAEQEDEEDEEDEDEDGGIDWTLRKCSASGLDTIANHYQANILDALLPHIHSKLQDPDWKVQESAVLAMGALAEGCEAGLLERQYLPNFIVHLINAVLNSDKPLLRSITCWTLSRYSRFISYSGGKPDEGIGGPMLEPLVMGLLKCMLDNSKRVQEAAVSAMAVLEEEARMVLMPHVPTILQVYAQAFSKYQAKNLIILYDACGTLADSIGKELMRPDLVNLLLPPLLAKWESLKDEDRSLFPMLECLSSVVQAVGLSFVQYAQPVFNRSIQLIGQALESQEKDPYNCLEDEYIVCSLDLISGMAEGLEGSIESLVSNSQLLPMMMKCFHHISPDVRQSAFALLGDLAKTCLTHLRPYLEGIFPSVQMNLDPEILSVCNNACWSVGEIVIRLGSEVAGVVNNLLIPLINLMCRPQLNRNLLQNTAITIGRFGFVCPEVVAPSLQQFIQPWCKELTGIRDDIEKEHAFRGLIKMATMNPQGCLDSMDILFKALDSWQQEKLSPELRKEISELLQWFKANLESVNQWQGVYGRVPQEVKEGLQAKYGLPPS
ncbi:hypothetical protein GUITHDRAFT_138077 [Guillardia theta CCMP2712]|uniref:Importin N-terminal domain-containing protein n=2 Tax=Guillardia theta TaxID=55529 RepID=L1JDW7_GUITC|nr:hypothetical protein GUITHDRAFT_138077 [Guillardia theta CCMP2712]EKX46711.1 hypothetical protein GUITHDRAFT_138077 [Guillardia theta CCMP2712]|eukprot:XP_005833691.1 hypothetical protein GUITHDRAFT_138077 [Guillardia theta CCMP2712]